MKPSYDSSVFLLCPTCAATEFVFDPDLDIPARVYSCQSCKHTFSHEEILASKANRVSTEVEKIKTEIISDVKSDFRKAFSGLKGWKIK